MPFDHADQKVVEEGNVRDVIGRVVLRAENVRSNCHCQVVRCHFVDGYVRWDFAEELNVELQSVEVEPG